MSDQRLTPRETKRCAELITHMEAERVARGYPNGSVQWCPQGLVISDESAYHIEALKFTKQIMENIGTFADKTPPKRTLLDRLLRRNL
jgi:hypothetical protein